MKICVAICLLAVGGTAFAAERENDFQKTFYADVLQPWVASHYPAFHYFGPQKYPKSTYSWEFRSGPNAEEFNPALLVWIDFTETKKTAAEFFSLERSDMYTGASANTPAPDIGDEASAFDVKIAADTSALSGPGGGWVKFRVGRCLVSVRASDAMYIDDAKALAKVIADKLPDPSKIPAKDRASAELQIQSLIGRLRQMDKEEKEDAERLATKTFVTAGESYQNYIKEHPDTNIEFDEKGTTLGGRTGYEPKPTGISEIGMQRDGCFGPCPMYSVQLFSDGRVLYFGRKFVEYPGMRTGKLRRIEDFQLLAEFVKSSGIENLKSSYETGISDHATVYTVYVIDRKSKVISNYASSAPPQVWAVEQLIDKLVSEVEWDKPGK